MDTPITNGELTAVLRNVGRGIGLDGVPPTVCNLFPTSLCEKILNFLQFS